MFTHTDTNTKEPFTIVSKCKNAYIYEITAIFDENFAFDLNVSTSCIVNCKGG